MQAQIPIQIQVILYEIDCSIFYTNLYELFCQFISWTNWVNSGKFMDNCWISCQVMADMKKVYDDLIIINLFQAFKTWWGHQFMVDKICPPPPPGLGQNFPSSSFYKIDWNLTTKTWKLFVSFLDFFWTHFFLKRYFDLLVPFSTFST